MKILAIETTGLFASVAILEAPEIYEVYEKQGDKKLSHLQKIIPMIEELLTERGLAIGDLTHIVVSLGPGSFTGIRIGMATAKALAQALNLPIIGVPSLKALARNAGDFPGLICPVLDARREQVYAGGYIKQNEKYVAVIEDGARSFAEFMELVEAYCQDNSVEATFLGDDYGNHQKASSVALEAFEMAKENKIMSFNEIKPVYLRQAEAQRKLEESQKR